MAPTITVAVVALILAWLHDYRLARQTERHAELVRELVALKNPDLEQLLVTVENLCQRIQAPEQAVVDHVLQVQPMSPPAVPMDDDDAFWKAQELPKEQLAEVEMQAELEALRA